MVTLDPKIIVTDKDTLEVPFKAILDATKTKLSFEFKRTRNNSYQFDLLPNAVKGIFGKKNDTISTKSKRKTSKPTVF